MDKKNVLGVSVLTVLLLALLVYAAVPTISILTINTTTRLNLTTENLTAYWNTTDGDLDNVKNITNWFINGSSYTFLNMPFEVNQTHFNGTDYSGRGNHVTDTLNINRYRNTGGFDGFGAFTYTGSADFLTTGSSELKTAEEFTITVWINATTLGPENIILWQGNSTGNGWGSNTGTTQQQEMNLAVGDWNNINASNVISFFLGNDTRADNSNVLHATTSFTTTNAWRFVAVRVYNMSTSPGFDLWLDGVLKVSDTGTVASTNRDDWNNTLRVGSAAGSTTNHFFRGTIDDLVIYNRSLSPEQIVSLYNNRTDLLDSNETDPGDKWSVQVTGNDGTSDGPTIESVNVTVHLNASLNLSTGGSVAVDVNASFYSQYLNSSNGHIASANCTIVFSDGEGPYTMTEDATSGNYNYSRTFSSAATYGWNSTCSSDAFYLNLTDNSTIVITAAPAADVPEFADYALIFLLITVVGGFFVVRRRN